MSDLDSRYEKCEQAIEKLRGEVAGAIELVAGVLVRVDEVLVKIETSNRLMFADLRTQTEAGFARLKSEIDALPLPLSARKKDEPPKMN
jgi:hypothetical protein